jgi:hypothetical protein
VAWLLLDDPARREVRHGPTSGARPSIQNTLDPNYPPVVGAIIQ